MGPKPQVWEGEGSAGDSPTFSTYVPGSAVEYVRLRRPTPHPPTLRAGPILLPQGEKDHEDTASFSRKGRRMNNPHAAAVFSAGRLSASGS